MVQMMADPPGSTQVLVSRALCNHLGLFAVSSLRESSSQPISNFKRPLSDSLFSGLDGFLSANSFLMELWRWMPSHGGRLFLIPASRRGDSGAVVTSGMGHLGEEQLRGDPEITARNQGARYPRPRSPSLCIKVLALHLPAFEPLIFTCWVSQSNRTCLLKNRT